MIDKTLTYLHDKLKTEIRIGNTKIDILNRVVLEDVYIEDQNKDTILNASKIKLNFNLSPFKILLGKYEIEEISLEDVYFKMQKNEGQTKYNFQFILDAFKNKTKEDTKSNSIDLNINDIYLSRVHFIKNSIVGGQKIDAYIEDGVIHVNKLDFDKELIDIRSVDLRRPYIGFDDFTAKPLTNVNKTVSSKTTSDSNSLKIIVRNFNMKDGHFVYNDYHRSPIKLTSKQEIDYKHLDIYKILIDIDDFEFQDQKYSGKLNKLSFLNSTGFSLQNLEANQVIVNSKSASLNNCKLITASSEIGDTLSFKYKNYTDFLNFNDNVIMNGKFKNSKVAVRDVMEFAPDLRDVSIFKNNVDKVFLLNGNLFGKVNSLSGKNLDISILHENFKLQGEFSSRNFAVKDEEMLNLKINQLNTHSDFLQKIIPDLRNNATISRIGKMNLNGRFDGFFADFVAQFDLLSDLGKSSLDVRMDLLNGAKNAKYSGNIDLENFELGKLLNDQKIGKISTKVKISEGSGFATTNGTSNLNGIVRNLEFNQFNYENINLNGQLKNKSFVGKFDIKNDVADIVFNGNVNFEDKIPKLDFVADINKLNLQKTKFTNENYELSTKLNVNFVGDKLSNIDGSIIAKNIQLTDKSNGNNYILDSLHYISKLGTNQKISYINLQSDLINANLKGDFNPDKIINSLLIVFRKNYPGFYNRLKLSQPDTLQNIVQNFDYQIDLKDSKNFMKLLKLDLDSITNFKMSGYFDSETEIFLANVDLEKAKYQNFLFDDCALKFSNKEKLGDALFILRHLQIGKTHFAPIFSNFYFDQDSINFALNSANFNSILDNLNLNGKLYLVDTSSYLMSFSSSDLRILEKNWEIKEGNFIKFNKEYVDTRNFELTYLDRIITLASINRGKGLELNLKNLSIHYLDEIWKYDELEFNGKYNITLTIKDLFELQQLSLVGNMDSLKINNRNFGSVKLNATMRDLSQPAFANLSITNDNDESLELKGYYSPSSKSVKINTINKYEPNSFKADFQIKNYPLAALEYFIPSGIHHTIGNVSGNLSLFGNLDQNPNIEGKVKIDKASTVISYINTKYTIDNQYVTIDNYNIDASNAILKDTLGNIGKVYGGIKHDHLKNFKLEVNLQSPKIIALNTSKKDNPQYYGFGIGNIEATFSGPFNKTDIGIVARASKGTKMYIPIGSNVDESIANFVKFREKPSVFNLEPDNPKKKVKEQKGISLDMELSIDTDSEIQLLFDEEKGDIIKGRGRADLQINIPRSGKLSMYGNYNIESGDYLFTLYNFFNKPFNIKKGGSIQWTGDPFEANINIDADYKSISTAPYNLISNYLVSVSDEGFQEARRSTQVELILYLKGKLLKPDIQFDIKLPNLPIGNIKTIVDQQLTLLKQDQNEMNRQVFGLIIAGTFLQTNEYNPIQVSTVTNTGFNTVSEMVSNQLSRFISDILSGSITDNSFISGIDFNMKYIYDTGVFNTTTTGKADEFEIRPKVNFFNDRVTLNYGFVTGSNVVNIGTYNNHDVSLDFQMTNDNKLRLRVYYKGDQYLNGTPRKRAGIGFTYREEFDKFGKTTKSNGTNN